MKQYYIVKGKKVWGIDRSECENPIFDFSLFTRYHPTEIMPNTGKKIPIAFYRQKQWFRNKKVAIAYAQFLIEKQALEWANRADNLRRSKITLMDATDGRIYLY